MVVVVQSAQIRWMCEEMKKRQKEREREGGGEDRGKE